ncbi:protein phosphatase inhibitor 2 [Condylostylus longicornis]|uniref:protein phosphatase inhibitor 2 n=1 Tax=Condylostylus longicornis TaxID=2530218 RepID=UPI00244DA43D|nr:protein phosphatase inhibitor 2 [Condylostylus longicornis]
MQGSPDAKKPCKGILKTSSSFDKHSGASHRKSAKFDEINVLQTYHPPDKDYGHMKIEEPKTPYNYVDPDEASGDQLDAELLAKKLAEAANTRTSSFEVEESSDEDLNETEEEKVRRIEFEKRRKAHYNEFAAVRLARKLIEEEDDDDDDDTKKHGNDSKSNTPSGSGKSRASKRMDVEDEKEDAQNTSPCSDN